MAISRFIRKSIRAIRLASPFDATIDTLNTASASTFIIVAGAFVFGGSALASKILLGPFAAIPLVMASLVLGTHIHRQWKGARQTHQKDYETAVDNAKSHFTTSAHFKSELDKQIADIKYINCDESDEEFVIIESSSNSSSESSKYKKIKESVQQHIIEDYYKSNSGYGVKRSAERRHLVSKLDAYIHYLDNQEALSDTLKAALLHRSVKECMEKAHADHEKTAAFRFFNKFKTVTKSELVSACNRVLSF